MPKKILLADDSITIQKVVELTFSDGDYEVSAVNNGAKAIQKLSELRPDIILSDIIMPEKNGYEVCEYVKSHPEYRNIPVVLLTGTFEPFDPDRADKAGCDAVVTKPFESQSLISKVEELISAAQSAPPAAAPVVEPVPEPEAFAADTSPWAEEAPAEAPPPPPPVAEPFAGGFQTHDADIFSAPAMGEPPMTETPFDSGAFGGETRAFPRMSFEELEQLSAPPAPEPPPAAPPEPPPAEPVWSEASASPFEASPFGAAEERGTQAFPQMSIEELEQAQAAAESTEHVTPGPSPWDAGPEESTVVGDTMSPFAAPEPPSPPAAEPSPWDEPPVFAGETRAFPRMSFEELQQMASEPAAAPEPPPAPPAEPSPWEPQPPLGGETRAYPRMSFEELQATVTAPAEEPSPWSEEPAESPFESTAPSAPPSWSPTEEPAPSAESFATEGASPFAESLEEQEAPFEPEMTAASATMPEEPAWTPSQPQALAEAVVNPQITDEVAPPAPAPSLAAAPSADLTDDQIDRIARRVVQLMSEQVVRNIAWEVIPDLAEMVVKERIRELESEA
jgi:CheY-like chemotaxis protein